MFLTGHRGYHLGLKPNTYGSVVPPHPGKGRIPHLREGLTSQIPHSPGTENSQMPEVYSEEGGGGRGVEVSVWSTH